MCVFRVRAQATETLARARARPALTYAPARRIGAWWGFPFRRHVCVETCHGAAAERAGVGPGRVRGGSIRARASVFVNVARRLIYMLRADVRRDALLLLVVRDNRARTWHGRVARMVARVVGRRARALGRVLESRPRDAPPSRLGPPLTAADRRRRRHPPPPSPRFRGWRTTPMIRPNN